MKALLRHVFCWANKNEMSFGLVSINRLPWLLNPPNYALLFLVMKNVHFTFGMYSIPKASVYIYLGIPFSNDLSLEPIYHL